MKNKKILLSAIAIVIAGLMISTAAGVGIQKSIAPAPVKKNLQSQTISLLLPVADIEKEIVAAKIAKLQTTGVSKISPQKLTKVVTEAVQAVDSTSSPMSIVDYDLKHPGLAYTPGKGLVLAYEDFNNTAGTRHAIIEGVNYTANKSFAVYYPSDESVGQAPTYPSADYWGAQSRYFVSYGHANVSRNYGDPTLIRIVNPGNSTTMQKRQWGFSGSQFNNFDIGDVACDSTVAFPQNITDQPWGVTGWLGGYSGTSYPTGQKVPFLQYPIQYLNNNRYSTMSWYTVLNAASQSTMIKDCANVATDIDPVGTELNTSHPPSTSLAISYQVYDWPNVVDVGDPIHWTLGVRWDEFEYLVDGEDTPTLPVPDGSLGLWSYNDSTLHIKNPVVSCYNSHLVIIFELYGLNAQDPNDADLVCWYNTNGRTDAFSTTIISASSLYEKNPDISWISGTTFQVAYTVTDPATSKSTLYMQKNR